MKLSKETIARLPGWGSAILMIFFTVFWAYWGTNEMYHEGWWGAWYNRLPYLAPLVAVLIPSLLAFRWPVAGGSLILLIGGFALFFFSSDVAYIGLAIALVGVAFITDGILKRRLPVAEKTTSSPWWLRHWRYLALLVAPLIVFLAVSAMMLPVVLTRMDDGNRAARLIRGNEVDLVWAPEGPGWNWMQSYGGYPSWQGIALYGVTPVGLVEKSGYGRQSDEYQTPVYATAGDMAQTNLCLYLSADGLTLLDEPQQIWRMPTTDELIRSLVRHGENAGCRWQDEFARQVDCEVTPDKESPLWVVDQSVIYYLSSDSYNEERGYFVAYNGSVNATNKLGGNPRHGYRCVREP